MQENPTVQSEQIKPEPDWELLQEIVDFMDNGKRADVIQLMSLLTQTEIDYCSRHFLQEFWEAMAVADPEEALNYRRKYIDQPYGWKVLQKIALEDPQEVVNRFHSDPEDPTIRRLYGLVKRNSNPERMREMINARPGRLTRWLCKKLFADEEEETSRKKAA